MHWEFDSAMVATEAPPSPSLSKSRRLWLSVAALSLIVLFAWSNSFQCGFVFDNQDLIRQDPRVQEATPQNLQQILIHGYWGAGIPAGLYRPVTTLSYLLNYAILKNGDQPAGYHLINLALHMGNVILLLLLARRLVGDEIKAFLITAVWAVHPVLTESVTNIVGRADMLAGLSTLGGILLYLRSQDAKGRARLGWLAGLAALTTVGLFSKESAVMVAPIIILYELIWWKRDRLRGLLTALLALLPVFLLMAWARWKVLTPDGPAEFPFVDNPISGAGFWSAKLTAIKVLAIYLERLVWPLRLSADYSYNQIPLADGRHAADWIGCIVVAAAAITVILLYRRSRLAFFAAGFAFLTLLPSSNLVFTMGAMMAERFLYLPAAGFAICLTLALYAIGQRLRLPAGVPVVAAVAIMAALGVRTWERNKDWKDQTTFAAAAARTSPDSFKVHMWKARALMEPDHMDMPAALAEIDRGMAVVEPLPDAINTAALYYRNGLVYYVVGTSLLTADQNGNVRMTPEAAAKFRRARTLLLRAQAIQDAQGRVLPWEADLYLAICHADRRLGIAEEALRMIRKAQAAAPLRADIYTEMHDALLAVGEKDEARNALLEGMILSASADLEHKVVAEYADLEDVRACAISYEHASPELNSACPAVRQSACAMAGEILRLAAGGIGGNAGVAARKRAELAAKYGCTGLPG